MNHVTSRAGIFKEGGEAPSAFGLHRFGPAGFVPFRTGLAFGHQTLLEFADKLCVFTMRGNDHAQLFRQHHGRVHLAIFHSKEVLIGEENLE